MVRYEPDHRGMTELLTGPAMRAIVTETAERIAAHARSIAPVRSGEYVGSISVEVDTGGARHDRAVGYVVASSDHAAAVEWGTSDTPAFHVLQRSIDASRG